MNFMELALEQAFFAIGESRPNPAVGAVVVKDGLIVGRGRTQRPGGPHAEVMALRDAGECARGAAIYVTLEPCCHYGRTPPCTKAIIEAGIAKVFFAHADPNPVVRGKSRAILEEVGIEVYEGEDACIKAVAESSWEDGGCGSDCHVLVEEDACENDGHAVFCEIERFFEAYDYFVRNKRTFVEIKSAVSQDGFMGCVAAGGKNAPLRITGDGANCWNHELRAMSDAVLVGTGTLLADNPHLDVRLAQGNSPVKAVWAGHHEFTAHEVESLHVFAPCAEGAFLPLVFSCVAQTHLNGRAEVVELRHGSFAENWRAMVDDLSARGMHRLMVEPGAGLAREIFAAPPEPGKTLWNRIDFWHSSNSLVEENLERLVDSGSAKSGLRFPGLPSYAIAKESAMIGPDVLTVYYP